ncbi:MAG: hypothetical protein RLZZ612_2200 [Pseudomonadota bacterium]|jgi:hypothetical protein
MLNMGYVVGVVALVLGLGQPVDAQAAKKHKKQKVVKVVPAVERTASGETVADRERRLRRECKGRANAGACLGFTN